jgi:hypothetical protein
MKKQWLKFVVALIMCIMLLSCGYSQRDSELIGQVKKVSNATPLFCPNYIAADLSLGVMMDGVGSMSTQDKWVVIQSRKQFEILKHANDTGAIVKITYDTKRFGGNYFVCTPPDFLTDVSIVREVKR